MDEKMYTLGFSVFSGIGTRRFGKLIIEFGSAERAWNGKKSELVKTIGKLTGQRFSEFREKFDIKKYAKELQQKGIQWLVPSESGYPKLLKQLSSKLNFSSSEQSESRSNEKFSTSSNNKSSGSAVLPGMTRTPFILFAKGNTSLLQDEKTIAIVGTRKVTNYGMQVTEMITRDLVLKDFTIVSGMALGVDAAAHREALKNKGKTVAVLGSGVDVPTPRQQYDLYNDILKNGGLVVSTFSPGEDASVGSFPARNAIIAGLSLGVVVTEGAVDSGALITAQYAKKFGRPVWSVPGQITSQLSQGTNNLIKSGAIPISTAHDILEHFQSVIPNSFRGLSPEKMLKQVQHDNMRKGETKEEEKILNILQGGPLHFDEIVRTIGKDSRSIGSLLSLMELKGMIKSSSEGKYLLVQ